MPKVSILLTSYNHAPFLSEAIDSVLAQTFADFELIIWDDNSTDGSWEIIESYSDPRIRSYRNAVNMGPVYGINKAILEVATGEFFAMHHSDDVWVADKLAKQLACFQANPHVAAVFTEAQAVAEEGFELDDDDHYFSSVFRQPNRTRHEWLRYFFEHGNALCHPSVLIRRSVHLECGLYSEALWQLPDFDMWVRLLLKHDIHVLPERLVRFRVRSGEANTSADRPDSRIQWAYEFPHVLDNFRHLTTWPDIAGVFPEAAPFYRGAETDLQFALGRAALQVATMPQSQLFALNVLRDLFVNPATAERIKKHHQFGILDFLALTRQYDVYKGEACRHLAEVEAQLNKANETLKERIDILELQKTHLHQAIDGLQHSISWRVSTPVRMVGGAIRTMKAAYLKLGVIKRFIARQGGVVPVFSKARLLYQRDGLAGLKRGLGKLEPRINPGIGSGMYDRNDYTAWVAQYDTLDDVKRTELATMVAGLAQQPLISVVMPTYQPNPQWLHEAVDSVRNQIYPNWELCIADDASPDPEVKAWLNDLTRTDSRIRVVYREQNGHISAASNSALAIASGQWVALLDHDDILPADALARVAECINQHPDAGVIYSDEDKINEHGERLNPYFKPDWNPDLFLSQNMVSHLGVFRRDLIEAVGGFRLGLEGSQDYDLALRIIEQLEPRQIIHIPRVLYHWRVHSGSTALSADVKTYAQDAAVRALGEHLQRTGIDAKVELTMGTQYRIRYPLPATPPLVSLIIPTRNALALVKQCIDSILAKTTYSNYEILLIDNASDAPAALAYFETLKQSDRVRVIRDDRPFNYSMLNNSAVQQAHGELIALVNNDIEVITPNWLEEMVSIALQPGVGAVGACLWYPDDTLQHGGVVMGLEGGSAGHSQKHLTRGDSGYNGRSALIQSYSAVTAACLVVKKDRYFQVGGLDEKRLPIAFNDVDFCLKLREAGYRNVWTPYAELYHHESATRGKEDTPEKLERALREVGYIRRRWKKVIAHDPAYSPNLTIYHEDFSLAWPPRV